MGHKNQFPVTFQWQATNPATGFLPIPANQSGSTPSGVSNGAMASTNVIYSQIIEISRMDNMGLEVTWSGTPTGTIEVMVSNHGVSFYALTFNPALGQPAGSAGGYAINVNQIPFKYVMLRYTNASGTGTLNVYGQLRDLN